MTAEYKVHLITWNVGETDPPRDLDPLFSIDKTSTDANLADIFVVGLQELKSDTSTLLNDSIFDDPWTTAITLHLAPWDYVRIKSLRLVGIHMAVYVKRRHLGNISNIESEYTRTGLGGFWGNKGAVSIRFELNQVNFCFVNSHLSAHMENFSQRIEEYNQVVMGQKFRDQNTPGILEHDYVFWMGDLNFRIDNVDNDVSRKKIMQKDLAFLLQNDQLNQARLKDLILIDFDEGSISFPPTYKFDPQTDTYDTSVKNRVPAWCDRILWRLHEDSFHGTTLQARQLFYTSLPAYKNSDHKPVVSAFNVKVLEEAAAAPVIFEPLGSMSKNRDQNVSFTIPRNFPLSSRDWVGLYPSDFKHFEDYMAYSWLGPKSSDAYDDSFFLFSVPFEERFLDKLPVGSYVMLYFSAVHNCVVSYSNQFKLLDTEESSSSSASEDEGVQALKQKLQRISSGRQQSALRGGGGCVSRSGGKKEVVEHREEVVSRARVPETNTLNATKAAEVSVKVDVDKGSTKAGVVGAVKEDVRDERKDEKKEEKKDGKKDGGRSNVGASAFEDAYMKLREEGQREKKREMEERKGQKGGNEVQLKITEDLSEEEKKLRMQAVDRLLVTTHLDNIAADFDDLLVNLDDDKKKDEDDGAPIKAKSEFKLLVDENLDLGGKTAEVVRQKEAVGCEVVRKTEGANEAVVGRADSGVLGCSTIRELGGMQMGAELQRSGGLQAELERAFEGRGTEQTGDRPAKQQDTQAIKKDGSLNDFEVVDKHAEEVIGSKMDHIDNHNNNQQHHVSSIHSISHAPPSKPLSQPPSQPPKQPPKQPPQQPYTLVGSPFEDAYNRARETKVEEVAKKKELPSEVEKRVEGMISNLNLDDFSDCIGLNPSGKLKKSEMDEERWRQEKKGGDIKQDNQYDLLIDEVMGGGASKAPHHAGTKHGGGSKKGANEPHEASHGNK